MYDAETGEETGHEDELAAVDFVFKLRDAWETLQPCDFVRCVRCCGDPARGLESAKRATSRCCFHPGKGTPSCVMAQKVAWRAASSATHGTYTMPQSLHLAWAVVPTPCCPKSSSICSLPLPSLPLPSALSPPRTVFEVHAGEWRADPCTRLRRLDAAPVNGSWVWPRSLKTERFTNVGPDKIGMLCRSAALPLPLGCVLLSAGPSLLSVPAAATATASPQASLLVRLRFFAKLMLQIDAFWCCRAKRWDDKAQKVDPHRYMYLSNVPHIMYKTVQ